MIVGSAVPRGAHGDARNKKRERKTEGGKRARRPNGNKTSLLPYSNQALLYQARFAPVHVRAV